MSEILLVSDVINYLKVNKDTVYRLIREGKIRAINIGNEERPRYRIRRDELEEDLSNLQY